MRRRGGLFQSIRGSPSSPISSGFPKAFVPTIRAYADAALTYLTYVTSERNGRSPAQDDGQDAWCRPARWQPNVAASQGGHPDVARDLHHRKGVRSARRRSATSSRSWSSVATRTTANAINNGLLFLGPTSRVAKRSCGLTRTRSRPSSRKSSGCTRRSTPPIASRSRMSRSRASRFRRGRNSISEPPVPIAMRPSSPARRTSTQTPGADAAGHLRRGEHFCLGANLTKIGANRSLYGVAEALLPPSSWHQPVESIEYHNTFASRAPISVKVRVRSA